MISKELMGIIVGGLFPAVLFALSGVTAKFSNHNGIGIAPYIVSVGIGVVITGLAVYFAIPEKHFSQRSLSYGVLTGIVWGLGAVFFALAITKYGMPYSKVAPLNNTSTLFAILLGFLIFSEWQQVNAIRLVFGGILVVIGSVIVSKS